MPSFYQKNGYDVQITVGTLLITTALGRQQNGLCDALTINAACGQSRTAVFSFIPPETVVNLNNYEGKAVKILIRTAADGWQQVFTGIVDTPRLDFITRKITLECSDNRQNRVIQMPVGVVSSIGYYSDVVFGTVTDRAEELTKRLETVTADFDFDRFGKYALTSWTPKATADYTLNSSDISREVPPTLDYNSSAKSINTIKMTVNYKYPRLHQQHVLCSWPGYGDFLSGYYNAGRPSFPSKQTIQSAATGSSWKVVGDILFTELWEAQGFNFPGGVLIWQPNKIEQTYAQRQQNMGRLPGTTTNWYKPVTDKNGSPVMDVVSSTITDTSSGLCRGASWLAAKRFSQDITESYTFTIRAPQAIAKYGVIDSNEVVGIDSDYDTSEWDSTSEVSNTSVNFFINKKLNVHKIREAQRVMLNRAKARILSLYRNYVLTVRTKYLKPKLDVWNTLSIAVNETARGHNSYMNAKGKVNTVSHNIDFNTLEAYTVVSIKLSRSSGSASNSAWTIPAPSENSSYIYSTVRGVGLSTYIGEDPDLIAAYPQYYKGWICNGLIDETGNYTRRTQYPEYFVMDYPEIPERIRKPMTFSSTSTFNIAIPNDFLEVSF